MFSALPYIPHPLSHLEIFFTYSHADAVKKLLENRADIAIVPENIFEGLDNTVKKGNQSYNNH